MCCRRLSHSQAEQWSHDFSVEKVAGVDERFGNARWQLVEGLDSTLCCCKGARGVYNEVSFEVFKTQVQGICCRRSFERRGCASRSAVAGNSTAQNIVHTIVDDNVNGSERFFDLVKDTVDRLRI